MSETLRTDIKKEKNNLPDNPYQMFDEWMKDAEKQELNDPNAMALATADKNAIPSVRMVLLKGFDERGFVFYTNSGSKKGQHLEQNQNAALCFHWKSLHKQVRVEGEIEIVSDEEANAYYDSRHWSSRVGAWASKQSQELESYEELQEFVAEYDKKFEGQDSIPRPDYWKGFRIKPKSIEFWIDGEYRLHRRYLYTLDEQGWTIQMLYP